MSTKRIVAVVSLFALSILMLFVYPSIDKSIYAGQLKSTKNVAPLTNVHQIAVSSSDVIAQYFGKGIVEKIMKQPGCVGVRMYYGKHADGKFGFVIVGVDKNGKEVTPNVLAGPASYCPPICND